MECPCCGHENEPMGILGNRAHFRCLACGWMYSTVMYADGSESLSMESAEELLDLALAELEEG